MSVKRKNIKCVNCSSNESIFWTITPKFGILCFDCETNSSYNKPLTVKKTNIAQHKNDQKLNASKENLFPFIKVNYKKSNTSHQIKHIDTKNRMNVKNLTKKLISKRMDKNPLTKRGKPFYEIPSECIIEEIVPYDIFLNDLQNGQMLNIKEETLTDFNLENVEKKITNIKINNYRTKLTKKPAEKKSILINKHDRVIKNKPPIKAINEKKKGRVVILENHIIKKGVDGNNITKSFSSQTTSNKNITFKTTSKLEENKENSDDSNLYLSMNKNLENMKNDSNIDLAIYKNIKNMKKDIFDNWNIKSAIPQNFKDTTVEIFDNYDITPTKNQNLDDTKEQINLEDLQNGLLTQQLNNVVEETELLKQHLNGTFYSIEDILDEELPKLFNIIESENENETIQDNNSTMDNFPDEYTETITNNNDNKINVVEDAQPLTKTIEKQAQIVQSIITAAKQGKSPRKLKKIQHRAPPKRKYNMKKEITFVNKDISSQIRIKRKYTKKNKVKNIQNNVGKSSSNTIVMDRTYRLVNNNNCSLQDSLHNSVQNYVGVPVQDTPVQTKPKNSIQHYFENFVPDAVEEIVPDNSVQNLPVNSVPNNQNYIQITPFVKNDNQNFYNIVYTPIDGGVMHGHQIFLRGDVVIVKRSNNSICYAQIKRFFIDQYGVKSATLCWLLPSNYAPSSFITIDPTTYIVSSQETLPVNLNFLQFVTRPSSIVTPLIHLH